MEVGAWEAIMACQVVFMAVSHVIVVLPGSSFHSALLALGTRWSSRSQGFGCQANQEIVSYFCLLAVASLSRRLSFLEGPVHDTLPRWERCSVDVASGLAHGK